VQRAVHTPDGSRPTRPNGSDTAVPGGKIWYSPDGSRYARIFAELGDNLVNPMFVGPRVVFLSGHEGTGALYSALPDGSDLRRHTDLGEYYARHPATDRAAGGLPAGRGDLAAGVARLRAGAPGHTAQRRALRPGRLPAVGEVAAGLVHARPRRPGACRRGPRHRALAARPGRAGPGTAGRARRARPAAFSDAR